MLQQKTFCLYLFNRITEIFVFDFASFFIVSFVFFVFHILYMLQFTWLLDSQPIMDLSLQHRYAIGQYVDASGDVIAHLNISHVRADDGGLYKCIATNSMGSVEHAARLNVYGKFIVLSIPFHLHVQVCYLVLVFDLKKII